MSDPLMINWAGGEHAFRLRLGEIRALDDKCEGGAYAAWYRLRALAPRTDDVIEVMRLGLIGGGMPPKDAAALVLKVEEQAGIGEMLIPAAEVLFRAFHRAEGEDVVGEPMPATETAPAAD